MTWTTRTKPSTTWDRDRNFCSTIIDSLDDYINDYNLMNIDGTSTYWADRGEYFFSPNYYPFQDTGYPFQLAGGVQTTTWTNRVKP
jgi:hypothetical protein